MFSTRIQLQKRTPENGIDRENYLSLLVDEYLNSSSFDAKCQVLANLANFSYDPVNYGYIRDVGVLDIFLYVLKNESNYKLLHFACAGVCNLCLDPLNTDYILNYGILSLMPRVLRSENDDIITSSLTILIQLNNILNSFQKFNAELIEQVRKLKSNGNKVIVNLATIFVEDVSHTK
ncbi:armadillo repeat-containing protein 7 [Battus philenor]|uniref:armadillo repeat-containing protein 7 n=1 Tax=Battus philenor TaxID=42288 RepID=UPI0035D060F6